MLRSFPYPKQLLHPTRGLAVRHDVRRQPRLQGGRRRSEGGPDDIAVAVLHAWGGHVGGSVHPHRRPADFRYATGGSHPDKGDKKNAFNLKSTLR